MRVQGRHNLDPKLQAPVCLINTYPPSVPGMLWGYCVAVASLVLVIVIVSNKWGPREAK